MQSRSDTKIPERNSLDLKSVVDPNGDVVVEWRDLYNKWDKSDKISALADNFGNAALIVFIAGIVTCFFSIFIGLLLIITSPFLFVIGQLKSKEGRWESPQRRLVFLETGYLISTEGYPWQKSWYSSHESIDGLGKWFDVVSIELNTAANWGHQEGWKDRFTYRPQTDMPPARWIYLIKIFYSDGSERLVSENIWGEVENRRIVSALNSALHQARNQF